MKDRKFRVSEFIHGADYNPDQWLDMPDIIEEDFRLFAPAGMNSATIGIFRGISLNRRKNSTTLHGWIR